MKTCYVYYGVYPLNEGFNEFRIRDIAQLGGPRPCFEIQTKNHGIPCYAFRYRGPDSAG